MRVKLIVSPYDSGRRDWRQGRGPLHVAGAVAARLARDGNEVDAETVEASEPHFESRTAFELCRGIAARARAARAAGFFPLVLSGNCSASVGLLAGLETPRRGVVWLDAHGDFNTPEISPSGYLDGMSLAVAAGRCWTTIAGGIDGHTPLGDDRIVLIGARDVDPGERDALLTARLAWLSVADVRAGKLAPALGALAERADGIVLHVDMDVHDPERTQANSYPAPGGLYPDEVRAIARQTATKVPVLGATLAAFDPGYDASGETAAAVVELAGEIVAAVSKSNR